MALPVPPAAPATTAGPMSLNLDEAPVGLDRGTISPSLGVTSSITGFDFFVTAQHKATESGLKKFEVALLAPYVSIWQQISAQRRASENSRIHASEGGSTDVVGRHTQPVQLASKAVRQSHMRSGSSTALQDSLLFLHQCFTGGKSLLRLYTRANWLSLTCTGADTI